ncbi:MAG: transcriptional regulator [Fluviicola sp.]|nr:MAG: transcriptional regulator [Fluviicola sp.]
MEEKEILLGLAIRLKDLRKSKDLTQEDVYNDTGIHIARIEQGKRDISYSTLIKLSRYFEITLDYFDESQLKKSVSESEH